MVIQCSAQSVTDVIGATLRALRISQRAAATQLGVTHDYLHRRLTGKVPLSLDDTLALACLLELDLADLLAAASATVPAPPAALAATTPAGAHAVAGERP